MLVTLDLSPELKEELQTQAEAESISLSELIEKLLCQRVRLELTIEEIETRYTDEWVLVEITEFDDNEEPTKGIVINHQSNRELLTETIKKIRKTKPQTQIYTFYTGNPIPEGTVVIV